MKANLIVVRSRPGSKDSMQSTEITTRFELSTIDGAPCRLVNGQAQTLREGGIKRAAKAYRVTDPRDIASKLEERGYQILSLQAPKIHHSNADETITRQGRRFILFAQYPDSKGYPDFHINRGHCGGEYVDFCKFLLDHSGRESFKVKSGALRCACTNQFYGADCFSLRHTDSALDQYLERPWVAAEMVRGQGQIVADRITALRGVGNGVEMLLTLEAGKPRLYRRAVDAIVHYPDGSLDEPRPFSFWSALQAFTATRAPSLVALASKALTQDWEIIRSGNIPIEFVKN